MLIFFIVIAGLSLLVLGHEAGHFFVAKLFKLKIDEFGFGFPPRIFAKKRGETEYSFNWLPFGGFVRIAGENDHMGDSSAAGNPDESARFFSFQPAWRKSLIILAGVAVNFVLGWMFLSFVFAVGTPSVIMVAGVQENSAAQKAGFLESDIITNYKTVQELAGRFSDGSTKGLVSFEVLREAERIKIAVLPSSLQSTGEPGLMVYSIQDDSPAIEAGLKEGDIIRDFASVSDFIAFVREHMGETVSLEVARAGETLTLRPRLRNDATRGGLGVFLAEGNILEGAGLFLREAGTPGQPVLQAISGAFRESFYIAKLTFSGFYELIKNLFFRGTILEGVVGPVGIFSFAEEAGRVGFIHLLNLMGIISINLAVINLIPFPALDGGRFFIILIEKIKGSPIPRKAETIVNTVGFVFLIFLMIAITVRDVINL